MVSLILGHYTVYAQDSPIAKSNLLLGGDFSLDNTKYSNGWNTTLGLSASGLYFVSQGLAIGGSFHTTKILFSDVPYFFGGIGPSVEYYFSPLNSDGTSKGNIHPVVGIKGTFNIFNAAGSRSSNDIILDTIAGIVHMVTSILGIDNRVYYTYKRTDFRNSNLFTQHSFGIRSGMVFFIY
jgi:hypothetical protein